MQAVLHALPRPSFSVCIASRPEQPTTLRRHTLLHTVLVRIVCGDSVHSCVPQRSTAVTQFVAPLFALAALSRAAAHENLDADAAQRERDKESDDQPRETPCEVIFLN